jgi:hypothetical protein
MRTFANYLDQIDVTEAELSVRNAFKNQPTTTLYFPLPVILDTQRMYQGHRIMREKKLVQIEEIGREL